MTALINSPAWTYKVGISRPLTGLRISLTLSARDCVNLIDYLEMTTELYMVNAYLTAISHKLGSGVAIVAIQKKQGATFGRGQEFGLEKPKLYLSLDKGKLQIVKGKSWAKRNVEPNGLQISFKISDGCQFQAATDWERAK